MKILFPLFAIIFTGCTTLGLPITEFQASGYDSIEDFIENNFKVGPSAAFGDNEKASTGVHWKAFYNSMNYTYIHKPANDLKTYCSVNGGIFKYIPYHSAVKLEHIAKSLRNAEETAQLRYSIAQEQYNWKEYPARLFTRDAYQTITAMNTYSATHANQIYDELKEQEEQGYLGMYSCAKNEKPIWLASIELAGAMNSRGLDRQAILIIKAVSINTEI